MKHEDLLKMVQAGAKEKVLETSAETYGSMPNAVPIGTVVTVKRTEPKMVYRQEGFGATKTLIPCVILHHSYLAQAVKSEAEGHDGELIHRCYVEAYGFDVKMDASGAPMYDRKKVDKETIETPIVLTKDEDGNPLEPKRLMSFKLWYGSDPNQPVRNRPTRVNMRYLDTSFGVPVKDRPENAEFWSYPIDWSAMPSFEADLMNPLNNALLENNTELLEFIKLIPRHPNAPTEQIARKEQEAKQPKYTPVVGGATKQIPANAFAGAPEDEPDSDE